MAKRMHIVLEDDVDGSTATQTVAFSLDGVSYEIDLNDDHAQQLREAMAPWQGHARRVAGRKNTARKNAASAPNDIRAWATGQGMQVNARGRVPADIREAYEKAHA